MTPAAEFARKPPRSPASAAILFASEKNSGHLIHLLLSFGLLGLFLVSIVDSSFVPLPVPGVTDIMIIVMAAQHANVFLLVGITTLGSALGGYFSFKVAHAGGVAFLEKHVPERTYKRVTGWMENHAILSVALPAILPPPMPLSPFVLAAGALDMSQKKFLTTFTISRFLRHLAAAAIGIHYGASVLHLWNLFTRKYGVAILSVIWASILISVGIAFWKLYNTSKQIKAGAKPKDTNSPPDNKPQPHPARV
jgi:membrane protein YqaA with SNARE-associated domain